MTCAPPPTSAPPCSPCSGSGADKSGIVYCSTRAGVERVEQMLREAGFAATRYHAGLEEAERQANQEDFQFDRKPIMVATNAFGMGIDKSNVSFVIHYNMPKSLEAYYQEAGRAGRDGAAADCILLFSARDIATAKFLIENSGSDALTEEEQASIRRAEQRRLKAMVGYCRTTRCLRGYILDYFGQEHPDACGQLRQLQTHLPPAGCDYRGPDGPLLRVPHQAAAGLLGGQDAGGSGAPGQHGAAAALAWAGQAVHLRPDAQPDRRPGRAICWTFWSWRAICAPTRPTRRWSPLPRPPPSSLRERRSSCPCGSKPLPRNGHGGGAKRHLSGVPTGEGSLYDALRETRSRLAREESVPAYVVFSNATLADMAEKAPRTHGRAAPGLRRGRSQGPPVWSSLSGGYPGLSECQ